VALSKVTSLIKLEDKRKQLQDVIRKTKDDSSETGQTIRLNRMQNMMKDKMSVKSSLLAQACSQLLTQVTESGLKQLRRSRAWKVNFVGEGADDYSGPYHESISVMSDEINKHLQLLVPPPNGQDESTDVPTWAPDFAGEKNKIPNPRLVSDAYLRLFRFVGVLMGIAIRNNAPIKIRLPIITWKQIAGEHVTLQDIKGVDQGFWSCCTYLLNCAEKHLFDELCETTSCNFIADTVYPGMGNKFVVLDSRGRLVDLMPNGRNIPLTFANRKRFVELSIQAKLAESSRQISAICEGLSFIVPLPLIRLFSGTQLRTLVCGAEVFDIATLKMHTDFSDLREPRHKEWLWSMLAKFNEEEQVMFLRFVRGISWLPPDSDWGPEAFKVKTIGGGNERLPMAHSCFFSIDFPHYTSEDVMTERTKYAMMNCRAIDTDESARTAMVVDDDDGETDDEF
jgi:hypothetical protein